MTSPSASATVKGAETTTCIKIAFEGEPVNIPYLFVLEVQEGFCYLLEVSCCLSTMIYCFDLSLFRRLLEVHTHMFPESQNECFALLASEHEKHCLASARAFFYHVPENLRERSRFDAEPNVTLESSLRLLHAALT